MALDPERRKLASQLAVYLARGLPGADQELAARAAELALDFLENELLDAEGYRHVRDKIQSVMIDPDSWCDDTWEPELMGRVIEHLAQATHGDCERCGEPIKAGDQFEEVGRTGGPQGLPILDHPGCV